MSHFNIVFRLRQHTPLIHFQSDQPGATIRATELKPKLDRFLIRYAFKEQEERYRDYLITPDKPALDYKIRIVARKNRIVDLQKFKSYFGNMGKKPHDPEYRKAVFSSGIEVSVFSYNTELIEQIEAFFASFLSVENFGTRQSKGFGSFYLDPSDLHYVPVRDALAKTAQQYIYGCYPGADPETVLNQVEVIYPLMKTGINYPDLSKKEITDKKGKKRKVPDHEAGRGANASYYRSFLFRYMYDRYGAGNEKRFIKERFFSPCLRIDDDGNQKYYVRALLGTADGVTFRDKRKGTIHYTHDEVKRFKSPLTFKIVDACLYIIAHDNTLILDKTFTFSDDYGHEKIIQTPSEFDLYDFLIAFAEDFNDLKVAQPKNIFDKKILQAQKATLKRGEE